MIQIFLTGMAFVAATYAVFYAICLIAIWLRS